MYKSLDVMNGEILKVLASIEKHSMFNSAHLRSLHGSVPGMTPAEINKAVRRAEKLGLVKLTDDTYTRSYKRGRRLIQETVPSKLVRLSRDTIDTIQLLSALHRNEIATVDALLEHVAEEAEAAEAARFAEIDAENDRFFAATEEAVA